MGKGGVGKSSTVNSIVGERAVTISPFQVFNNSLDFCFWVVYIFLFSISYDHCSVLMTLYVYLA